MSCISQCKRSSLFVFFTSALGFVGFRLWCLVACGLQFFCDVLSSANALVERLGSVDCLSFCWCLCLDVDARESRMTRRGPQSIKTSLACITTIGRDTQHRDFGPDSVALWSCNQHR
ncbi:hypothetical protein V8C35DRAFT_296191 [Trichoderma chlorosporum]